MAPHFPNEVLLIIFKNLVPSDPDEIHVFISSPRYTQSQVRIQYRTLSSLCLVSKGFKALAMPVLYTTYIKPRNDEPSGISWRDKCHYGSRSLRSFMTTLLKRRDLCAAVSKMVMGSWIDPDELYEKKLGVEAQTPYTWQLIKERFGDVAAPNRAFRKLVAAAKTGHEDAEVAIVLCLTPNVTALDLRSGLRPNKISYAASALRWATEGAPEDNLMQHTLPRLRSLVIKGPLDILDINIFNPVRATPPTLTHLDVQGTSTANSTAGILGVSAPGVAKIQSLILRDTQLGPPQLRALVERCPALRTLHMSFIRAYASSPTNRILFWRAVARSSESARASLAALRIVRNTADLVLAGPEDEEHTANEEAVARLLAGGGGGGEGHVAGPVSLVHYAALRSLAIPHCVLVDCLGPGHDLRAFLPRKIRELAILQCTDWVFGILLTLLAPARDKDVDEQARVLRAEFPHLRAVDVGWVTVATGRGTEGAEEDFYCGTIEHVHAVFLAAGIDLNSSNWLWDEMYG